MGGGWNNDLWGGELPLASWIDDVTADNPVRHKIFGFGHLDIIYNTIFICDNYLQVWLSRMDGHMGLANSLALKLARITNSSEDPNGGTIMRTGSGGKYLVSF